MITSPALRPPVTRLRYSLQRVPDSDRWLLIGIQGALTWYVSTVTAATNWEAELIANDITGEGSNLDSPKDFPVMDSAANDQTRTRSRKGGTQYERATTPPP